MLSTTLEFQVPKRLWLRQLDNLQGSVAELISGASPEPGLVNKSEGSKLCRASGCAASRAARLFFRRSNNTLLDGPRLEPRETAAWFSE
jgi:hypothetical protein